MIGRAVGIGVAVVAGVVGATRNPGGAPEPPICAVEDAGPAAVYAVAELARSLGDLDALCGDGFTARLREAARAMPDETIDPLDLVPPDQIAASPSSGPPSESTLAPEIAAPALSGSAELVAAGAVSAGAELDLLVAVTTAYCSDPATGLADLVAASRMLGGRIPEWSPNRIAVAMVGERCAPLVDDLVGRLDFGLAEASSPGSTPTSAS
ncbi:hypothetical protein [Desertimonas flava]|uniref:hypothetical protein n=1 Tax=Desertimonas flava TaxID=2064846 RepID=UPI000E34DFE0|nr:hypothetical protein [Desertimonas flava]